MTPHVCPADGCTVRVAFDRLFCARHWHQVPMRLKGEVWRAWHRGAPDPDYLDIRQQAIDAVNERGAARAAVPH